MNRLLFQKEKAKATTGIVINVGCKEDPAALKSSLGERVINADICEIDTDSGLPINIDVLMDCREPWPFEDDYAELVIMAEIIEHLYVQETIDALKEARRVAPKLVLTLPYDFTLPLDYDGPGLWKHSSGARGHCTGWSEPILRDVLDKVGYTVKEWQTMDYGIMGTARLDGFLIYCERR